MPGQLRIYALLRPSAFAIGLLAWSVPALAKDGADGAATIRAELAAWTQASTLARQIRSVSSTAGSTVTVRSLEPGMDIFKRQDDGTWKIIRYLAYSSPE
jgi:hypothetical protein